MAWIKRNLVFAVCAFVALALMGAGVWYLLSKMSLDKSTDAQLAEAYTTLDGLASQAPGDPKVAEEQIRQLRETGQKFRALFKPIPPIPYTTNLAQITSAQFATTLQVTIDQLQRGAAAASVDLPPQYGFSFQAERSLTKFAAGSLGLLAVQLGEVKAICDILYGSRVNALLSIRREKVSTDDDAGGAESYLDKKSITQETATLTPYEVSFRCFGTELSAVLTAFASSPYCLVVESVNVEAASGAIGGVEMPKDSRSPNLALARGGLPTFLDEELLKVTVSLQVVKLNSNPKR